MKTLSFLIEGKGDVKAVPALVKRLLTEYEAWDSVRLSPYEPFRIGGLHSLAPNDFATGRSLLGRSESPISPMASWLFWTAITVDSWVMSSVPSKQLKFWLRKQRSSERVRGSRCQ